MVVIGIIFELVLLAFVCWGILHEEKLILFERKLVIKIKTKVRKLRRDILAKTLAKYGLMPVPIKKDIISVLEHETK